MVHRKSFILLFCLFACVISSQAKGRFGVKAGYDISKMELSTNVLDASHRNGNYIGATMNAEIFGGFSLDISAIYDAKDLNINDFEGNNETLSKKSGIIQLDFRKGFGFGDASDVFIFAGPQWEFNLGTKEHDVLNGGHLKWKDGVLSVNVGVGVMLFGTVELRAAYNIASDPTSDITIKYIVDEIKDSPKGSTWQLGIAVYF